MKQLLPENWFMKEFEKWFRKAESDLLVIKNNLISTEIPIDACCFHAQQAAEKYIKAYLVSRLINFPKTHDLQSLLNLCISVNQSFNNVFEPCIRLFDFAIAQDILMHSILLLRMPLTCKKMHWK